MIMDDIFTKCNTICLNVSVYVTMFENWSRQSPHLGPVRLHPLSHVLVFFSAFKLKFSNKVHVCTQSVASSCCGASLFSLFHYNSNSQYTMQTHKRYFMQVRRQCFLLRLPFLFTKHNKMGCVVFCAHEIFRLFYPFYFQVKLAYKIVL